MRVYTKVTFDMETGETLNSESYEHAGPIAECKRQSWSVTPTSPEARAWTKIHGTSGTGLGPGGVSLLSPEGRATGPGASGVYAGYAQSDKQAMLDSVTQQQSAGLSNAQFAPYAPQPIVPTSGRAQAWAQAQPPVPRAIGPQSPSGSPGYPAQYQPGSEEALLRQVTDFLGYNAAGMGKK